MVISRHQVVDHQVAQEHLVGGPLVLRVVARHALHQPGGRLAGEAPAHLAAEQQVVLEDVGELVEDQLVQLGVGEVHRQHHAEAHVGGEGAHRLGDEAELDVVLLELGVRLVEDQRRRALDLVVQPPRQLVVGALGEGHHALQQRLLLRVVVHVEVRRVVDLPLEGLVLDLVLAELRRGGRRQQRGEQQQRDGVAARHGGVDGSPVRWFSRAWFSLGDVPAQGV